MLLNSIYSQTGKCLDKKPQTIRGNGGLINDDDIVEYSLSTGETLKASVHNLIEKSNKLSNGDEIKDVGLSSSKLADVNINNKDFKSDYSKNYQYITELKHTLSVYTTPDQTNLLIGVAHYKNKNNIGLYKVKTDENKSNLEISPLLSNSTVKKIFKIEDIILIIDDNGDLKILTPSHTELIYTKEPVSEVQDKLDLPRVIFDEKFKFENFNLVNGDTIYIAIYQSSDNDIVVVQLYPEVKTLFKISKIFSGRISDFNIVDFKNDQLSIYLLSITGKFSLYNLNIAN